MAKRGQLASRDCYGLEGRESSSRENYTAHIDTLLLPSGWRNNLDRAYRRKTQLL